MVIFSLFQIEFSLKNTIHDNDKNHYICKHKKYYYVIIQSYFSNIFPSFSSHRQRLRFDFNCVFINTLRLGPWNYRRFSNIE